MVGVQFVARMMVTGHCLLIMTMLAAPDGSPVGSVSEGYYALTVTIQQAK